MSSLRKRISVSVTALALLAGVPLQSQSFKGVFGWEVLSDEETLHGTVVSHDLAEDGDWCIKIRPAPADEFLLVNSDGILNANGLIEAEIEPPHLIGSEINERRFMSRLIGKTVTVTGVFVADKSHDNKTEIHPISSILADVTPPGSAGSVLEFFVFSDDSDNVPASVPYSHENRFGEFVIPVPRQFLKPAFTLSEVIELADSVWIDFVEQDGQRVLLGNVESGVAPERGFYHAVVKLFEDR